VEGLCGGLEIRHRSRQRSGRKSRGPAPGRQLRLRRRCTLSSNKRVATGEESSLTKWRPGWLQPRRARSAVGAAL